MRTVLADLLYSLVFCWVVIPWMQAELDSYVFKFNTSPRRKKRGKILPHGPPQLILEKAHMYQERDFRVSGTLTSS